MSQSDIFARMLCQQHGVTPSIALAVVEKYPSVGDIINAYDECQSQEEMEDLLTDIQYEEGKKIRKGISQVIAWLYNERGNLKWN